LTNPAEIDMNSESFKLVQKGFKRDNELLRIYIERPNLFVNLHQPEKFNFQRLFTLEPTDTNSIEATKFKQLTLNAFLGFPIEACRQNYKIVDNNLHTLLTKVYPKTANLRGSIAKKSTFAT